jgi:hypothetical protein
MKPDADDVTRLLALLVAICGEQTVTDQRSRQRCAR